MSHIKELAACGANTIRTYDTTHFDHVMKEAAQYNIAVIAGLDIPKSDYIESFYADQKRVDSLVASVKKTVLKYKDSPALLMWCLGNELYFPRNPRFKKFYDTFNSLVDFIHETDPNHPVTTTMINFDRRVISNIYLKTDIDIISFNIFFGKLKNISKELKGFSWFWNEPYIVSEWGYDGPWTETGHTAWSVPLELKDYEKAKNLNEAYYSALPKNDGRILGDIVFYWGFKQETTDSWFSFFSKQGDASAMVNTMKFIWSGQKENKIPPVIVDFSLNKLHDYDNIILTPGKEANAAVTLKDTTGVVRYEWKLLHEDWARKEVLMYNQKLMKPLDSLTIENTGNKFRFTTPLKEGPYRIAVTIYNNNKYFTSANIPFYVVDNK